MQIDPRTNKQLILMQITNNVDLSGTALESTVVNDKDDKSFQSFLEQYLNMDSTSDESSTDLNLEALANMSPYVLQTLAAQGNQGVSASSGLGFGSSKPTAYDELIQQASRKYGISESLIKAVIQVESSFNPNVVSSAGAKGLMQLMDGTARGLGVTNSFDPVQNIDAGTRYLSYQLARFDGQEMLALAAYNAGPNRVLGLGIRTEKDLMDKLYLLPKETQNYIRKINEAQSRFSI